MKTNTFELRDRNCAVIQRYDSLEYLEKSNLLSEFDTEDAKKTARLNLGIVDEDGYIKQELLNNTFADYINNLINLMVEQSMERLNEEEIDTIINNN